MGRVLYQNIAQSLLDDLASVRCLYPHSKQVDEVKYILSKLNAYKEFEKCEGLKYVHDVLKAVSECTCSFRFSHGLVYATRELERALTELEA